MQIDKLTDKQKVLAIAGLVVVACVCMILVQLPQSERGVHLWTGESIPVAQMPIEKQTTSEKIAEQQTTLSAVVGPTVQSANVPDEKSAPTANEMMTSSWSMGNVKSETPKIRLDEKIVEYAIVQLEQDSDQMPVVGQQVKMPLLNGLSLVANVESTLTNPNGDYTWSGHLEGYGTDYPVVMTYGEHSVFATITTPQGSYTMESKDGLGWLYKNPAEIELSNPGAKDYLDVPHP